MEKNPSLLPHAIFSMLLNKHGAGAGGDPLLQTGNKDTSNTIDRPLTTNYRQMENTRREMESSNLDLI